MLFFIFIVLIPEVVSEIIRNQTSLNVDEPYALKECRTSPLLALNELFVDYNLVFPQQSENSSFLLNLNNKGPLKNGTCIKRSELTLKQICRLDDKFGSGYFFNKTTKEMIEIGVNRRARIYWENNFQGSFEDWSATRQKGMCQNLERLHRNSKSVETMGTCIRLFYALDCQGWSLAIYPGSKYSREFLNTKLTQVASIGRCFDDEFVYSSYKDVLQREIVKNHKFNKYNPDLVEIFSFDKFFLANKYSKNIRYLLGQNHRVEFLHFKITSGRNAINDFGKRISKESNFSETMGKEDGDEMTFAIPLAIGGPNRTFNVFPASKDCVEKWTGIISNITSLGTIRDISINAYEKDNDTKPLYFYYIIRHQNDGSSHVLYGRVLNGNQIKFIQNAQKQKMFKLPKTINSFKLSLEQLAGTFKNWTNDTTEHFSNSSLPNFNKPHENLSSEPNCQVYLSFEDIQEIPEIADGNFVKEDYIQDMIGSEYFQAVLIFSGKNFTGKATKILSSNFRYHGLKCFALPSKIKLESVLTFGKCVRLHGYLCNGRSLEVYPGSRNSHAVLQFGLNFVGKIGLCSPKEFSNSTFIDGRKRHISKTSMTSHDISDLQDGKLSVSQFK